ncbi:VOC family protein [Paracoccus beibuensis]|uniref:VOC family protein n=1 Tax=Paracoccus beibuensis TaxID=547602 RepID=UPI00223EB46A|nr:hypothetical protein [Paracoccus beibuensis]
MTRIFINLPVADVAGATIHVMLLSQVSYATFTDAPNIDTPTRSGALFCLSFDSRGAVDEIHHLATAVGGIETRPIKDHGFMYGRAFDDPGGHGWKSIWMDTGAAEAGTRDMPEAQHCRLTPPPRSPSPPSTGCRVAPKPSARPARQADA